MRYPTLNFVLNRLWLLSDYRCRSPAGLGIGRSSSTERYRLLATITNLRWGGHKSLQVSEVQDNRKLFSPKDNHEEAICLCSKCNTISENRVTKKAQLHQYL